MQSYFDAIVHLLDLQHCYRPGEDSTGMSGVGRVHRYKLRVPDSPWTRRSRAGRTEEVSRQEGSNVLRALSYEQVTLLNIITYHVTIDYIFLPSFASVHTASASLTKLMR